jgi:ribonucleotide monophosphatase NagD (HAD superfamily)
MTYAPEASVEGAGVVGMKAAEGAGEGVTFVGDGDQVDVIWHKAVGENSHAVVTGIVQEEIEVELIVFGAEVSLLAVVTALCDVVRNSGQHQAGGSWHMLRSVWH